MKPKKKRLQLVAMTLTSAFVGAAMTFGVEVPFTRLACPQRPSPGGMRVPAPDDRAGGLQNEAKVTQSGEDYSQASVADRYHGIVLCINAG